MFEISQAEQVTRFNDRIFDAIFGHRELSAMAHVRANPSMRRYPTTVKAMEKIAAHNDVAYESLTGMSFIDDMAESRHREAMMSVFHMMADHPDSVTRAFEYGLELLQQTKQTSGDQAACADVREFADEMAQVTRQGYQFTLGQWSALETIDPSVGRYVEQQRQARAGFMAAVQQKPSMER